MESCGSVTAYVIVVGDFFREVVPVLFQAVARIQVCFFRAVGDGGEIADAEVDASGFIIGTPEASGISTSSLQTM
jgi:hypothetical protein|uniref:Uncharacterized protein n=1 Tax=uncultured haloarchaeon TaxID=160804 RepID=A0A0K1YB81_9EURY|nr:hypothetical protein [uncultured haloarchaeon]